MPDVVVRRFDDLPRTRITGAEMVFARAGLGVTSFGLQVECLPPHFSFEHDESESGQEEVYVVLSGRVLLTAKHQEHVLEPEMLARVAPHVNRQIATDEVAAVLLCIGGVPGRAFQPGQWSERQADRR
jgi:uncharacterized cupin superfamily protein